MANPFKDAEKKKKKAPGSNQEAVVEKEEVVVVETPAEPEKPAETPAEPVVVVEEEKKVPAKKTEKKEPTPAKKALDIFAGLEAEKNNSKTCTFYLNEDNVKKLKAMAEKKGISASKLLDHILTELL